jgi:hypothetical protein
MAVETKVLMNKNCKFDRRRKNIILSKIAFHLSLGLYEGRPSYRRSL